MYTEGPEPIRSATDPTPFANPSARLSVPTRTMHANAIAHAVVRVRRVRRVASRSTGLGMPGAHRTRPNKHSAGGPSTRVRNMSRATIDAVPSDLLVRDWSGSGHFLQDPVASSART